jgi:pyrimidine-nucleoside phosphorylase
MRAIDIIRRKRDGLELSSGEIQTFVAAAARGQWPDYQLSALLMAICCRGMTAEETATLTRCMADSGTRVDLSDLAGVKVDKHSTGGVGDKTSLILAPLAAACGVIVPMMSGRGLGHTGGTLDKLEAIPGYRVQLTLSEFRQVLEAVGMAMIGQTADLAPADRKLYALRDATATVESIPLITASILSKKLAEGISGLVIDVKCGSGAFMKTVEDARQLARSLIRVGTANGLTIEALITVMDSPLGEAVGNSVEVIEAIEVLKGRGPRDVSDLSIRLAAIMVRLAGLARDDHLAEQKVRAALDSGAGLERFRRSIAAQGGDPRVIEDYSRLPLAPHRRAILAPRPGTVSEVRAETIGIGATVLGAGRERAEDAVDPGVAIQVRVRPGQRVQYGETLLELHYHSEQRLQAALPLLESAVRIDDAPPPPQPLILEMLS